jgi:CIC family chloride channel protein
MGSAASVDGRSLFSWAAFRARWTIQFHEREEQVFLLLSLLIGALTGVAVVGFILVTERLGLRLFPVHGAAWRRIAMPVGGSLAMGYLLFRYFPNARGSGVPQTKAALFAHNGYISLRTVLGKFVCTATTLACGIPLGREGPSVQVGAGIASVLGRKLGLRPERVKALIPVGAAAAIAAAFNTPMAAVMFALEEVMGDLHAPVLGSVVLAAATSWAVLRLLLGNDPLFKVPEYSLVHPLEFGIYAVLGVAGGFLSVGFTRLLIGMRAYFQKLPAKSRWWHPVVGGVTVAAMGWFVPQSLGVGYTYVGQALNGSMVVKVMLLLLALKFVGVTVSYATGNAGGIFGPSLFLGAMLGGAIGTAAHALLPAYTAQPGAYALVGMGALFAGIVRAPMTSVLMIFEMTRDYAVIVPLMIANMTSLFIASIFQKEPIYESLAHQDGIHLPTPAEREEGNQRTVAQVMEREPKLLPGQMTDNTAFLGMVARETLEQALADGCGEWRVTALVTPHSMAHLHADQPLHTALERMSSSQSEALPVVHRADIHKLEGVVTRRAVLDSYGIT